MGPTRDTRQVHQTEQASAVRPVTPEAPQPIPLPQPQAPIVGPEVEQPERRRGDRRRRQVPVLLDTRAGADRRRAEPEGTAARGHIDEQA